jgi:hypothetical protein
MALISKTIVRIVPGNVKDTSAPCYVHMFWAGAKPAHIYCLVLLPTTIGMILTRFQEMNDEQRSVLI